MESFHLTLLNKCRWVDFKWVSETTCRLQICELPVLGYKCLGFMCEWIDLETTNRHEIEFKSNQ